MTPASRNQTNRAGRWFYVGVGVFVIVLSIAGFVPSLLDPSLRTAPPTKLVLFHGGLGALWLLLFLSQAFLIATGREAVHRQLGVVGAILGLAVVVMGSIASIEMQRRSYDLSGDLTRVSGLSSFPPEGVMFSLSLFFFFGALVAAALYYRHRPEIHKRLMMMAVIVPLAQEPVGHLLGHLIAYWPGLQRSVILISLPVVLLFYSVSAIHDRLSQRRIHPVSIWVPVVMFVSFSLLNYHIVRTTAWIEFSRWLLGK